MPSTPAGRVRPGTVSSVLDHLAEQARNRSLVLFVGAGASIDAKLPDWAALIDPLRQDLGVDKTVDLLDTAQFYADTHGRPALLKRVVDRLRPHNRPGPLHEAIARVPAPVIFTTNYDQLIERAIEEAQGVPPDVIFEDQHVALIEESQRTTVVKLHGCLSLPETIVLARDDYESYAERHRAMIAYVQSLLATRTFLFVGFSLLDPNFRVIDHTIRQAVGAYRRRAFAISPKSKGDLAAQYWDKRGIGTIPVPNLNDIPALVNGIADAAAHGSALSAAGRLADAQPPPPLYVQPLFDALASLKDTLSQLLNDPAVRELFSSTPSVDAPPQDATAGVDAKQTRWIRERGRSLLDLALAVDRLTPLDDPLMWIDLGDVLYSQGDAAGAIHAYHAALRPAVSGRTPGDPEWERTVLRVRGNLARALAHETHYARSEWLLRRCVFKQGMEAADGDIPHSPVGRWSVYNRLNLPHLDGRPTDASELVYAITRRAERLRDGKHPREAFEALCEARYLLEPLLGIRHYEGDPPGPPEHPAPNFFEAEWVLMQNGQWPRSRILATWHRGYQPLRNGQSRPFVPPAWALSFLGKCYRISCQTALDTGRNDATRHLERAEKYLRMASERDPLLPFPYGHRLKLAADTRLPESERRRVLLAARQDLDAIGEQGHALRRTLMQEFPTLFHS
jgi:hypothetical protein